MSALAGNPSTGQPLLSHATSDIYPDRSGYEDVVENHTESRPPSGSLDWRYFFKPLSVYSKNQRGGHHLRFRRVDERIPLITNILLGIQHAGTAFGNIAVPALILSWTYPTAFGKYAVQSAFIIAGLGSLLQCMRFKIPGTPYCIGTGLTSFMGTSLVFGSINLSLIGQIALEEGIPLDDAYGKILGTTALCSLVLVALSLIPRKYVKVMFPPLVCAIMIILIGIDVAVRGYQYWGGGVDCVDAPIDCHLNGNVVLPYGSPEYLGFGLMLPVILVFVELFGTPFMRQNALAVCVAISYPIAAIVTRDGKHYVSGDIIDDANPVNFLWTTTYKLGFDKSAVLPLIGGFFVLYLQATAVMTSTLEESKLDIEGADADDRIQGGLISMALMSVLAPLATGMPVVPIPDNNSVIYLSGVATRFSGIIGSLFLIAMGIFGHLLALELEVPIAVKGGITVPLAMMIILSGLRILGREKLDQRTSTIVVYSLTLGLGSLVVHNFITFNMWPLEQDACDFVRSAQFAVVSMMRAPYFLGGIVAITLHLMLPKEMHVGEVDSLPESEKQLRYSEE